MDYIFSIKYRQLPSHLDISELCSLTPNLTKLDVTYGVIKIGMNYERMLFGMKISDATKTFDRTETLTSIILSGNMIDDDLLRMLMTGLIKNTTITHIDLSHNKITNHGARLLSKLLGENSVISEMNLADNQIHAEGGRYLARGIRENDSLLKLNLRLNRLTDDGCRLLLEGLQDNVTLIDINIASNSAGSQSIQTLCSILRDPEHMVTAFDASGNEFSAEHFELMRMSMTANKSLTSIDVRNNPGYAQGELGGLVVCVGCIGNMIFSRLVISNISNLPNLSNIYIYIHYMHLIHYLLYHYNLSISIYVASGPTD